MPTEHPELRFCNDKFDLDGTCSIQRVKYTHGIAPHTHGFIELVYTFRGKGIHTVNGRKYSVSRGDLLLINYNCTHSIESGGTLEYADILIKPEFISESLKGNENAFSLLTVTDFADFASTVHQNNCFIQFSGAERDRLEAIVELMEAEHGELRSTSTSVFRAALNILLTLIFRKMSLPMRETLGINENLLDYIRANCHTHITLEELAGQCAYNPAYFCRLFKEYTGKTFTDFLADCRIERAKTLLTETELSVETIIGESGFSDRTKFFSLFAQMTGFTPLQYRKSKNPILTKDNSTSFHNGEAPV